jgi:hypothetical protein
VYLDPIGALEGPFTPHCYATPDDQGVFRFSRVHPGPYRVTATCRSKESGTRSLAEDVVVVDKSILLDLRLGDEGIGDVTGTVFENDSPVEKATVVLEKEGAFSRTAYTDDEGIYRFFDVPAGDLAIHVRGESHRTLKKRFTLDADDVAKQDISYVTGNGFITGRVLMAGDPMDAASVEVFGHPQNVGGGLVALAEVKAGIFAVENLPAGTYRVMIDGRERFRKTVQVENHRVTRVDFILD